MTATLVKKAHDGHDPQSDNNIENHELKATPTTGWVQQPVRIYVYVIFLFWFINLLLMSVL